jgi:exodeoxyribonuclease-3
MSLRVMTYNILDNGETRETQIVDVIQTAAPDVVILQEVFTEEFLQFLSRSLGMEYRFGTGNKQRKVGLLSRLPVRSFENHRPFPPIWRNVIDANIEVGPNRTVRILGVHPIANPGLPWEIWRYWEARYVAKLLKKHQKELCLLAGDLNAIAPGENLRTEKLSDRHRRLYSLQGSRAYHFSISVFLSAGLTDCFRSLHSEEGYTIPPPDPFARLDYIFANAKAIPFLKKCWIVKEPDSVNLASDHFPVMAEFSFNL